MVDYSTGAATVSAPITCTLANGYDEPLELTTKKSRDRKVADQMQEEQQQQHQQQQQQQLKCAGTFLKIPSLMKP